MLKYHLPFLHSISNVIDLLCSSADLLSGLLVSCLLHGLQDDVLQIQIHSFLMYLHHL